MKPVNFLQLLPSSHLHLGAPLKGRHSESFASITLLRRRVCKPLVTTVLTDGYGAGANLFGLRRCPL